MDYNQSHDIITGWLSIDDVSDDAAMGYDAAPRVSQEHQYLMTERPFSLGCQPKSGFLGYEESELPKSESGYYGIVTYNRELTTVEIQRYELVPVVKIKELV